MKIRYKLIDFVLITGIILITGTLLYALLKNEFYLSGSMKIYFFISVFGVVILAVVLVKGSDKFKVNLTLFLVSVGLCVYMTELFLVYYDFLKSQNDTSRTLKSEFNKKMGLPFDHRDSYQVMMDFKKDGIKAYPNIVPNQFVYTDGLDYNGIKLYPLSSLSDTTTILCNESGQFVIYKSDSHGFRNPEGLFKRNAADIVLIGDSFAHGNCVQDNHDTAGWLRNANKYVLNLGMQGSGPLIELAILKEYAPYLKPRYVFWLYFEGNDDRDLTKEIKSSILMDYLDRDFSQNLLFRQKQLYDILTSYMNKEIRSKELQVHDDQNSRKKFKLNVSETVGLLNVRFHLGLIQGCFFKSDPLIKEIFAEAKRSVNEWGGQLVVVYIPSWERYQKPVICRKRLLTLQHQQISDVLLELGIPVIDIQQSMDSHNDPLSLFPYRLRVTGHFNRKGYRVIAKEILDHIK